MTQHSIQGHFQIKTPAEMVLVDITQKVKKLLYDHNFTDGMCYLFNPHTTAGLTINEGADPDVQTDIIQAIRQIVPLDLDYRHLEGNSPSHVMASLFGSSLTLLVENTSPILGTWQKIFLAEFDGPRTRKIIYRLVP